ncbi:antiterminator LoaP [Clostridium butyricum]|nr:antiterminator LoaP [Clostridium butyricum]
MKWYALYVQCGNELTVQKWLNVKMKENFKSIVPRRYLIETKSNTSREIIKVIFPGYVFININMSEDNYYKIKSIPSILKVLSYNSYCTEIPEKEMIPILNLIKDDEIIKYSKILFDNSEFKILSGPLKNNEHMIKKINKHKKRASVYLKLNNEDKKIDLGIILV